MIANRITYLEFGKFRESVSNCSNLKFPVSANRYDTLVAAFSNFHTMNFLPEGMGFRLATFTWGNFEEF